VCSTKQKKERFSLLDVPYNNTPQEGFFDFIF
jgi:hypothetical protein